MVLVALATMANDLFSAIAYFANSITYNVNMGEKVKHLLFQKKNLEIRNICNFYCKFHGKIDLFVKAG